MGKQKTKIYAAVESGKQLLKSFEVQGYENIVFNALFYRNGKKLNSLEKADTQFFSKLILNYEKTENPDKIKVEFYNGESGALLWSKEYNVAEDTPEPPTQNFQGLGEAEINEIVGRRINDYERTRENEELKEQIEALTVENEELSGALEEATEQLAAKKQIEYYANLLGMAMPGLAKVLGKSQAGKTLGFLSGVEDEPQQIESTQDSRTAIVQLINEYMQSLDNAVLGKLYLVMCEFNADSSRINTVLELLTK